MHRRFAILLLALLMIGCERYRSRAQGPFPRNAATANAAQPKRPPLALSGPVPPAPPGGMDESPLVPPRPPEPGAIANAVPAPPKTPVVEEERVEPAGGLPPRKKPATEPPAAPKPTPAAATPAANFAPIKKLADASTEKVKTLGNYEAHFFRRENVDGNAGPLEEVIFRFRADPMAVYMKNVSETGLGREVLYNPSQHGEKIHVIVGKGDSRLLKAGFKAPAMSPDSPQVRQKSRHSIRESGVAIGGHCGFIDPLATLFSIANPLERFASGRLHLRVPRGRRLLQDRSTFVATHFAEQLHRCQRNIGVVRRRCLDQRILRRRAHFAKRVHRILVGEEIAQVPRHRFGPLRVL
jgi:hypothetical protein